jgi:hypothetical protein
MSAPDGYEECCFLRRTGPDGFPDRAAGLADEAPMPRRPERPSLAVPCGPVLGTVGPVRVGRNILRNPRQF